MDTKIALLDLKASHRQGAYIDKFREKLSDVEFQKADQQIVIAQFKEQTARLKTQVQRTTEEKRRLQEEKRALMVEAEKLLKKNKQLTEQLQLKQQQLEKSKQQLEGYREKLSKTTAVKAEQDLLIGVLKENLQAVACENEIDRADPNDMPLLKKWARKLDYFEIFYRAGGPANKTDETVYKKPRLSSPISND